MLYSFLFQSFTFIFPLFFLISKRERRGGTIVNEYFMNYAFRMRTKKHEHVGLAGSFVLRSPFTTRENNKVSMNFLNERRFTAPSFEEFNSSQFPHFKGKREILFILFFHRSEDTSGGSFFSI